MEARRQDLETWLPGMPPPLLNFALQRRRKRTLRYFLLHFHRRRVRAQCSDQLRHVLVTLHTTELALCLTDTQRHPATDHRLSLPPFHVPADAAQSAIHILDGIRRRERAEERLGQVEAKNGETLVQTLAETRGSAVFAVRLEPRCQLKKQLLRYLHTLTLVCFAHLP